MRSVVDLYRAAYTGLPAATWWLASVALVNRAGTMVLPFLALYFTGEMGLSADRAGTLLLLYGAGAIVGSFLGGWLTDKIGAVTVQVLSLLGAAVGFLVLAGLRDPTAIAALLFALGLVNEAFRPANAACLMATCDLSTRRKAIALNRLAINCGMAIGPALGGVLAELDYELLFLVDGATCALAAVLVWSLRRMLAPTSEPSTSDAEVATGSPLRDPAFLVAMALTTALVLVFFQFFAALPLYFHEEYGFPEARIGLLFAVNPLLIVLFEMVLVHRLRNVRPLPIVACGTAMVGIGHMLAPKLGMSVYGNWGPSVLWIGCGVVGLLACAGYVMLDRAVLRSGHRR